MGLSIFGTLDAKAIIEYGGLASAPMMPGFTRNPYSPSRRRHLPDTRFRAARHDNDLQEYI